MGKNFWMDFSGCILRCESLSEYKLSSILDAKLIYWYENVLYELYLEWFIDSYFGFPISMKVKHVIQVF